MFLCEAHQDLESIQIARPRKVAKMVFVCFFFLTDFPFWLVYEVLGPLLHCGHIPSGSRGVSPAAPALGSWSVGCFREGRVSCTLAEYSKCLGATRAHEEPCSHEGKARSVTSSSTCRRLLGERFWVRYLDWTDASLLEPGLEKREIRCCFLTHTCRA